MIIIFEEEAIEGWLEFAEYNENAKFSNRIWYSWVVDKMTGNPSLVGTWVVTWHDFSFRHIADGREVSIPVHLAVRIRDGKVDFVGHHYDQLSLYTQLGYQLLPPEPVKE